MACRDEGKGTDALMMCAALRRDVWRGGALAWRGGALAWRGGALAWRGMMMVFVRACARLYTRAYALHRLQREIPTASLELYSLDLSSAGALRCVALRCVA